MSIHVKPNVLNFLYHLSNMLDVVQEVQLQEQCESMQQAAGVSSNLDLVEACVSADTINFELFKCRAKGLSQYTWSQLCSVRCCF